MAARSKQKAPVDLVAMSKVASDYALARFRTREFHLGDFDKAAPVVIQELAEAWASGFVAGRDSV